MSVETILKQIEAETSYEIVLKVQYSKDKKPVIHTQKEEDWNEAVKKYRKALESEVAFLDIMEGKAEIKLEGIRNGHRTIRYSMKLEGQPHERKAKAKQSATL